MSEWISVNDRLPDSGKRVLFSWRNLSGLARTSMGVYAAKFTIEEVGDWSEDSLDYDESRDTYYRPEGWWEEGWEIEECASVSCAVTHWQPLPPPPTPKG